MNPWEKISLSDYEGHMALPTVGQATMIVNELLSSVDELKPKSLAILGCAGGNGLDELSTYSFDRLVCVDINASYVSELESRYVRRIENLECHVCEVERLKIPGHLDLVFGALIFEYTRQDEALAAVEELLTEGGWFIALIQMPASDVATVSPSPYSKALSVVIGFFRYVSPSNFICSAEKKGLKFISQQPIMLASGKMFMVLKFRKYAQPKTEL
jgi:Methyltransferase domain